MSDLEKVSKRVKCEPTKWVITKTKLNIIIRFYHIRLRSVKTLVNICVGKLRKKGRGLNEPIGKG